MSAQVGVPSIVQVDQDSGAMVGFREAELEFRDLNFQLHQQLGNKFVTSPAQSCSKAYTFHSRNI